MVWNRDGVFGSPSNRAGKFDPVFHGHGFYGMLRIFVKVQIICQHDLQELVVGILVPTLSSLARPNPGVVNEKRRRWRRRLLLLWVNHVFGYSFVRVFLESVSERMSCPFIFVFAWVEPIVREVDLEQICRVPRDFVLSLLFFSSFFRLFFS